MISVSFRGNVYNVKKKKGLTSLDLSNKGIKDIGEINNLDNLVELELLDLSNNEISEIRNIEKLTNLKYFICDNNNIYQIKGLENNLELIFLSLRNNKIHTIEGLDKLFLLQKLILYGNQISSLSGLENLVSLSSLDMRQNPVFFDLRRIFGIRKDGYFLNPQELVIKCREHLGNGYIAPEQPYSQEQSKRPVKYKTPRTYEWAKGLGYCILSFIVMFIIYAIFWSMTY